MTNNASPPPSPPSRASVLATPIATVVGALLGAAATVTVPLITGLLQTGSAGAPHSTVQMICNGVQTITNAVLTRTERVVVPQECKREVSGNNSPGQTGSAPGASMPSSLPSGPVQIGPLKLQFSTAEISPKPGSGPESAVQATLGIDFTNTGASVLRLALIPQWPVMQVDGGIQFDIRPGAVSGLQIFNNDNVGACPIAAENFSVVRPGQSISVSLVFDTDLQGRKLPDVKGGRVGGMLMVYAAEEKSCTKESFTAARVAAQVYR